jgi:hypothetical protein
MIRGPGRPKGYKLAKGDRVPSVTTITGRFKDSGGLIHWAWTQGIEGKDYRETKEEAADVGAMVHDWIDAYIHGDKRKPFDSATAEQRAMAEKGFGSFLEWATQVGLDVLETEVPLVSEKHRFGGTFDALAKVAGRVILLDWKSSGGVYADYIVQLAGYRELLRERGTTVDEAQLLRFGKQHGDFHQHHYPSPLLDKAWTAFLHMRDLYELDKELKKAAA